MIRSTKAPQIAMATLVAALVLPGIAPKARADAELPPAASSVRNELIALTLADAALPVASAVSATRDDRTAVVPASSASMKPETAGAMAAVKTASARPPGTSDVTTVSYDRRVRTFHTPFPLILGTAY